MTEPIVTFAIPFYRDRELLAEALDSVRAQSDDRWAAIVVDDAGPDPEACDLVRACDDPRISYHRNDLNLGLAGNWNRCLELASTDLVTLLHADDRLRPGYARAVIAAHERHPRAAAVFTRTEIIGPSGQPAFSLPDHVKRVLEPRPRGDAVVVGDAGLARVLRGSFIFCPTLCYRRSRLAPSLFDARWRFVVDLDVLARLLVEGEELVGVPEVEYAYRRHGRSETARLTETSDRFVEELEIYGEIAEKAWELNWARAARTASRARIVRLHLLYRIGGDLAGRRYAAARQKWALLRDGPDRRAVA